MYLNKEDFSSYAEYTNLIDENIFNFDNCKIKKLKNEHILDLCSDIIQKNKMVLTFDRDEIKTFDSKPKILSNTLYGTPDLWFILMKLNGVSHPDDFDCTSDVFIMNPENIPELLAVYDNLKHTL